MSGLILLIPAFSEYKEQKRQGDQNAGDDDSYESHRSTAQASRVFIRVFISRCQRGFVIVQIRDVGARNDVATSGRGCSSGTAGRSISIGCTVSTGCAVSIAVIIRVIIAVLIGRFTRPLIDSVIYTLPPRMSLKVSIFIVF